MVAHYMGTKTEFEHGVWGANLHLLPAYSAAAEGLYHEF